MNNATQTVNDSTHPIDTFGAMLGGGWEYEGVRYIIDGRGGVESRCVFRRRSGNRKPALPVGARYHYDRGCIMASFVPVY